MYTFSIAIIWCMILQKKYRIPIEWYVIYSKPWKNNGYKYLSKKSLVYKWKDITKYSGLKPGKQCNLEKPHCFFLIFRMELPSILSGMSGKWFVFTFFFPLLDHCVYYLTYPYIFFSSYRSFTFNEQLCSLQIEKYCHSNCVNERFHDYIQS